jgi:glucose-1-phosphate thymidylyltransferase
VITYFVEKPQTFVSDLAIIGIYYIKDGDYLKKELQYLLDNNIKDKGEYQLTNALENMKNKGVRFSPGNVSEWLDCGNKDATVYTNQRVLEFMRGEKLISEDLRKDNAVIIEPCYVAENVEIRNSVVGPYVSVGAGCRISDSVISNSIIQSNTKISNLVIDNSMIGNHVEFSESKKELSLGDYSVQVN